MCCLQSRMLPVELVRWKPSAHNVRKIKNQPFIYFAIALLLELSGLGNAGVSL
jgi:hypothetical protein